MSSFSSRLLDPVVQDVIGFECVCNKAILLHLREKDYDQCGGSRGENTVPLSTK
jgi:hypothetical protein